jgi:hypothetical protein
MPAVSHRVCVAASAAWSVPTTIAPQKVPVVARSADEVLRRRAFADLSRPPASTRWVETGSLGFAVAGLEPVLQLEAWLLAIIGVDDEAVPRVVLLGLGLRRFVS